MPPPLLAPGAQGVLDGRPATIKGCAILSTPDDGPYQWHEYRLEQEEGAERILVHEMEDGISIWKIFSLQPPDPALDYPTAFITGVGQKVSFGGASYSVTYRGKSRVIGIQGTPPSGYRSGQEDTFFNAEGGDEMLVVSWNQPGNLQTYLGRHLPSGVVARVFGIREQAPSWRHGDSTESETSGRGARFYFQVLWIGLVVLSMVLRYVNLESVEYIPPAPPVPPPPTLGSPQLQLVDRGVSYQLVGHRIVEVRAPGRWRGAHFYAFESARGDRFFVVHRLAPTDGLLVARPVPTPPGLRPEKAALLVAGNPILIGGLPYEVRTPFQLRSLLSEGRCPLPQMSGDGITQGALARCGDRDLLVLWSENQLITYVLSALSKEDADLFGKPLDAPAVGL